MNWELLWSALAVLTVASVVIMYTCDAFEEAADFLGRHMKAGTKGATLNAIGSSLPELFTTVFLLFGPIWLPEVFGDHKDGFSAGIATCAGSALFNAIIIPALCIGAVVTLGVKRADGSREKVRVITLNKSVVLRDGFFFIMAELALIYFLADPVLTWGMGAALAMIYVVYISYLLRSGFQSTSDVSEAAVEPVEPEKTTKKKGILWLGWLLDFNERFFRGQPLSTGRAWWVLMASILLIALACAGIAWAVERSAEAFGVEPYFTAVILAAAATSLPDMVLSVKDALKGEYDDAIANAVGSNVFDICIGLGVPLMLYGLTIGPITLVDSGSGPDVQVLRWVLLICTLVVLAVFLIGPSLGRLKAMVLIGLYAVWTVFIIGRANNADWAQQVVDFFSGRSAQVTESHEEPGALWTKASGQKRLSHYDGDPGSSRSSVCTDLGHPVQPGGDCGRVQQLDNGTSHRVRIHRDRVSGAAGFHL